MTVAIAWVRRLQTCEELVFAADSRLSGGARTFDYCAKIMTLPRSDCAIAFAGNTDNAYPLMHQLSLAIESFAPLRDRVMDIRELKTHAVKIFDSMASSIASPIPDVQRPDDFTFLFGGYSWIEKKFFIWKIAYSLHRQGFVAIEAPVLAVNRQAQKAFLTNRTGIAKSKSRPFGRVAFAGDQGAEAERRLLKAVGDRCQRSPELFEAGSLDLEPFQVVCEMLGDSHKAHTIGGAPQILKVYEHLNAQPFAVKWPKGSKGGLFLQGRPLLPYENVDVWTMDPTTLRTSGPLRRVGGAPARIRRKWMAKLIEALKARLAAIGGLNTTA